MIAPTTFEQFREASGFSSLVPVVNTFSADTITPVAAYHALHRPPFGFLLESLVGGERWARYSFLGSSPREAWKYRSGEAHRWTAANGWEKTGAAPDPLAHIAAQLGGESPAPIGGAPRFLGGAVGYLGYDVVRQWEPLGTPPEDDLGLPDAVFQIADTVLVIDNAFGRANIVALARIPPAAKQQDLLNSFDQAQERIAEFARRLNSAETLDPIGLEAERSLNPSSRFPREEFESAVRAVKRHIVAGDAFQVVVSRRQDLELDVDPFRVYRCLRSLNPAPYSFHLALDELALVGSSPEVLVRVEEQAMTVRPIAGTRPRGANDEEDDRLRRDLLSDEKELAEHAMLVDLGRNDLGRSSEFGTVRVTVDKVVERYSHVQHIVSEVTGNLRPDLTPIDSLQHCFPAGTVSGAPKVRAMQIIDSLEPTRRGPYAGAVGYVGFGGHVLDTAIAIRTAVIRPGWAHVQAGAGIVADSVPEREFQETEDKAGAVLKALSLAADD